MLLGYKISVLFVAIFLVSYFGLANIVRPPADNSKIITFYVSQHGSDANNGTIGKPFATFAKARAAVKAKLILGKPITVYIGKGIWYLDSTLQFTASDGGSAKAPVTWAALNNEQVIISGAKNISGFRHHDNLVWKANCDLPTFRQLYADGQKLTRSRGPLPAKFIPYGKAKTPGSETGYLTPALQLAKYKRPSELELVFMMTWSYMIGKVDTITAQADTARISMLQPWFYYLNRKSGKKAEFIDRLENAYELIDQPGEWYYDYRGKTVYFYPPSSVQPNEMVLQAPHLQTLLKVQGSKSQRAQYINFKNITFEYSNWNEPSYRGLMDIQAGFCLDSARIRNDADGDLENIASEYRKTPGAVVLSQAGNIQFLGCHFRHLGGAGLDLENGSSYNTVNNCTFEDISSNGIQIGGVGPNDHHPTDSVYLVTGNRITNNNISRCASDYEDAVGIWGGYIQNTVISGNKVYNLPYTGISVGWGWGSVDAKPNQTLSGTAYKGPTPCRNNHISDNIIHNVMRKRRDGAAIYTLGAQPGTRISGNLVYENWRAHDIYLDEGSSGITVTGNTIFPSDSKSENIKNHVVPELAGTNNIINNYINPPGGRTATGYKKFGP